MAQKVVRGIAGGQTSFYCICLVPFSGPSFVGFWSPDFGFAFALAQRYDFRFTAPPTVHRLPHDHPLLTLSVVAFCLV